MKGIKAFPLSAAKHSKGAEGKPVNHANLLFEREIVCKYEVNDLTINVKN